MTSIDSIILGIVQGITEFLPISSTAHLTVAGKMMGLIDASRPEKWTSQIAVIQLGTLLAVLVYFYNDIIKIIKAFFTENIGSGRKSLKTQSLDSRLGWYIGIGTLPIVIFGLGFKDIIEGSLTKDLFVISGSLIALALVLFVAEKKAKHARGMESLKLKDAIWIGIAQSLALIPGASRSGTTITAGLFLGMTRESAARFSFLLSIPAVLASGLLSLKEAMEYLSIDEIFSLKIAVVFAALIGYAAIALLLKFLRTKSTMVFVVYRVIVGLLIIWAVSQNLIAR